MQPKDAKLSYSTFSSIETLLSWLSQGFWIGHVSKDRAYHPSFIYGWPLRKVLQSVESHDLCRVYSLANQPYQNPREFEG